MPEEQQDDDVEIPNFESIRSVNVLDEEITSQSEVNEAVETDTVKINNVEFSDTESCTVVFNVGE